MKIRKITEQMLTNTIKRTIKPKEIPKYPASKNQTKKKKTNSHQTKWMKKN